MTGEHRIITLIASATEIVSALGLSDCHVGRSHECDFPTHVAELPVCSASRIDTTRSSLQIDAQVKQVLRDALSVYSVDVDLLDELQPTLIITQSQCDVCAVSLKDVEQAVCRMVSSRPKVVSLEPNALRDVWADIRLVADAADIPERGEELVENLQSRLAELAARTSSFTRRPRVACIEWIDPVMAAGNWMPELVEMAGGENLFGTAGVHSPWLEWEQVVAADPDIIVVLPCGFQIDRCATEMPALTQRPEWASLKAVRNDAVFLTDGHHFFNRPGPRLAESAEILAEIFHPDQFTPRFHGTGWIRLTDYAHNTA